MYHWIRHTFPAAPTSIVLAAATLWYGAMIALAVIGAFEPQAEFQYLAM
jgi:hypothetical protein